jgi:hypothetical protein
MAGVVGMRHRIHPTAFPSETCLVRDRVAGIAALARARLDLRTGTSGTAAFSRFRRTTGAAATGGAFSDVAAFSFSLADDVIVVVVVVPAAAEAAAVTAGLASGEAGAEESGEDDVDTPVPSMSTNEWNRLSSCSFSGIDIDAHALRGGSKNSEVPRDTTPAPDRNGAACNSNASGLSRASCLNSAPTNTSSTRMPISRTADGTHSPLKVVPLKGVAVTFVASKVVALMLVAFPSSCTRRPRGSGNHIHRSALKNTSRTADGILPAPACRVTACATARGTHVPPMGSGARETVIRGAAWVYDTSTESGSPSMVMTGVRLTNEVSMRRKKGTLGARRVW